MVICENLLRIFMVTNSDNLKILEEMKHTILAIDDERSIRILLDNFLSQDYQIITKSDGLEALLWLESNLPDLIICDLQMPNMDGYQLIEQVRNRGYTKHTPIIMLSGAESSKERIRCYQCVFNHLGHPVLIGHPQRLATISPWPGSLGKRLVECRRIGNTLYHGSVADFFLHE